MKVCSRCKEEKSISDFGKRSAATDGLHPYCKPCSRESTKKSYQKDVEASRARDRERNKGRKEYKAVNNQKWVKENQEKHRENARRWYRENKNRVMARKKVRYHEKYHSDISFRLDRIIRRSLSRVVQMSGHDKKGKTLDVVGYSCEDLHRHIGSMFKEVMSWDNYGKWHIDHITPIKHFMDSGITDPAIVNALENLQPLWAYENLSKGDRIVQ
jgi:hypothetical protein